MGVVPRTALQNRLFKYTSFFLPLSVVRRRRDHDANNGGRGDTGVGDASVVGAEDFETIIYSTPPPSLSSASIRHFTVGTAANKYALW